MTEKRDDTLLKSWCRMEELDSYVDRFGGFADNVPDLKFKRLIREYEHLLDERIACCGRFLDSYKDALIYYTLAELHNRRDVDASAENLYKRQVRAYCFKAIRTDRKYAPAWALLAYTYSWIALFGGDTGGMIKDIEVSFSNAKEEDKPGGFSNVDYSAALPEDQKRKIRCIENALYGIRKAIRIEPGNRVYQYNLKRYLSQRNEEYKPAHLPRILW